MRGHIRQRGNRYVVVIHQGRDSHTGRKRDKWYTFLTRREAEAHLVQLLAHAQAGGALPPTRLRVGEFLEQWLRDYAAGAVTPSTLKSYTNIMRRHLVPALGHLALARFTAQAIQGYLSHALANGLSSTTVLYHYRVLHEALRHAVRWGLLVRNPTEFVNPPRKHQHEMRVLDEEQVRLCLAEAKRSSRYYSLYLSAVLTGMRQGELLGLRSKDVHLTLGTASIQQTFCRLNGRLLFGQPKTAKSRRTIALPPVLVEELRRLREQQAEQRRLLGSEYVDYDLIFCQVTGKPLDAHNIVVRDFRPLLRRIGLPPIRFHDLRHSHATHLFRQGVHPKIVQERLGHSTSAFTLDTYGHVLPGMQEEAALLVARRILGRD